MQNTVADLIIRIKNGYMARREEVSISGSNLNKTILVKLTSLHFIGAFKKVEKDYKVTLIYKDTKPPITDVVIYSKPGRRYYVSYKELKPILGGLGYTILSTPKGIMTNREARRERVGGELLFAIW